ncbi:putative DnaJ domain-containing protein [Rosa chinensis]|uniref:Putative DnaJ domain-containing protein n=1 Tax=Rosa chinensis TaxID=74649 RepID=A0A2P6QN28_ROSCH|nr:putative DnaJ domain-containing protein [Rosa chinensis]
MKSKDNDKKKQRAYEIDDDSGSSSGGDPLAVLRDLLKEFPNIGCDLKQLLQVIDGGKAVDINGLAQKPLIKPLRTLFLSLNLKELNHGGFVLPPNVRPTLERRPIGPEKPSPEILDAAAKLREAEAELREAELEEKDDGVFIGPAPRAVAAEAESANQADRFEEVTRIMEAEDDSLYEILGSNHNVSADNIKKRYWKLSLLVHPDKCSHPQANQAFVKLNKAFKELQDPEKRRALDQKIELREKQERFIVELRAMREAAMWRKMQGISMEGDEELLAGDVSGVKAARKRDEWMTELPPERKHGMSTRQSTMFSRSAKQGRGDTSGWTDAPSERAWKAKMEYLQAYNEFASLASNEEERKRSLVAELMDNYKKDKRSKSLLQKHQEEIRAKRKYSKQQAEEDWVGKYPWKRWDREKDLAGGRQHVKLDSKNMTRGLSSRFSGGSYQRNFL